MALIHLTGKYAIGEHACAIVDDEDFVRLSKWHWKAKPNGNRTNIYAVRNVLTGGIWHTIRMHRAVLNVADDDSRDVDHINHLSLDNRKINLRIVSRSINISNARTRRQTGECIKCGRTVGRFVSAVVGDTRIVCPECGGSAGRGSFAIEEQRGHCARAMFV